MEQEDFSSLPRKKLKKLIRETRETLELLQAEMDKRKIDKQHKSVDHMEEYFEDAEHNLSNIKIFFQKMIQEMKKD